MVDGLVIIGKDGKFQFVNPAFSDVYQYSREETIGMDALEVIHPDYHHVFAQFMKELEEKGNFSGETIDVRKDGTTFHTDVKGGKIHFKGKECFLAVIRDNTARKKAELALADSEKQLSDIIEFLPDPTWVIDIDGRVIA